GHCTRHRRAARVHARVRDRWCRRRACGRALGRVLQHRRPVTWHVAADLRVHRRRDRRARLAARHGGGGRGRRSRAAVRRLLRVVRPRRLERRAPARPRALGTARRPLEELRMRKWAVPMAILVVLALVPQFSIDIPYVFNGAINTPGTLQLLALCLVFGGIAMSYDLLFGYTGLLSFGHALYFAVGVYITAIAITKWHWSFVAAIAFTALVGVLLPLVLGAVS